MVETGGEYENQGDMEGQRDVPEGERNRMAYRMTEYGLEIAHKTSPDRVRHATRMLSARMVDLWYQYELRPPTYIIDNQILPQAYDRVNKLLIDVPLGMGEYSQDDVEAGLVGGRHVLPATAEDVVLGESRGTAKKSFKGIYVLIIHPLQKLLIIFYFYSLRF